MKNLANKLGTKTLAGLMVLVVMIFMSVNVQASYDRNDDHHQKYQPGQYDGNDQHHGDRSCDNKLQDGKKGSVGAPLDGGLLVLLAGAGITYFGARRKKKQQ